MKAMDRLLVCFPNSADGVAVQVYARHMHELLGGQISYLPIRTEDDVARIEQASCECDLIIYGEPKQSYLRRLMTRRLGCQAIIRLPTSLLVIRQSRWPIRTILLIVRVEETDEAAVEWVARLARPSGAKVTILPILDSFPSVYALACSEETALGELLSPNTQPGQQLRCVHFLHNTLLIPSHFYVHVFHYLLQAQ